MGASVVGLSVVGLSVTGVAVVGVSVLGAAVLNTQNIYTPINLRHNAGVKSDESNAHSSPESSRHKPPRRPAPCVCGSASVRMRQCDTLRVHREHTRAHVGASVVGLSVVGLSVVGLSVTGVAVVGVSVLGAAVLTTQKIYADQPSPQCGRDIR